MPFKKMGFGLKEYMKTRTSSWKGLHLLKLVVFGFVFVAGLSAVSAEESETGVCPTFCKCMGDRRITEVQCSGKNLTSVPTNLPRHIMSLDLSVNNITYIPDGIFSHYSQLRTLGLSSNKLNNISRNSFAGLHRLESLSLQGNQFEVVPPEAFNHLISLITLSLDANKIGRIPASSFKNLRRLRILRLDVNELKELPVQALSHLVSLQVLDLSVNHLESIPDYAFSNMTNLQDLVLRENRIKEIGDYAFQGLDVLNYLYITSNRLKRVPAALISLVDLKELGLEDNTIQFIPDHAFEGNKKLTHIKLLDNPIGSYGKRAFRNLPLLQELKISEAREVTEFPDLTGTGSLDTIKLDRSGITSIPDDICRKLPSLWNLDLHSNQITKIPVLQECKSLAVLNLGNNNIKKLESGTFANSTSLKDLVLHHNSINNIPDGAFQGLYELQYLDLSNNRIENIDQEAFVDLTKLEDLNLSENRFPRLPTDGLQNLERLKTFHNKYLEEPIPADKFPNVHLLVLSYAYHCCNFINTGNTEESEKTQVNDDVIWMGYDLPNTSLPHDFPFYDDIHFQDIMSDGDEIEKKPENEEPIQDDVSIRAPIHCEPMPGPFLPCDDLFGWWSLRCGVWIVFLLAVAGNGIVLFVSISGRSKMDVPRFLICNLACADFCMGVYLGMLAIVDASTLGKFQQYAVSWQVSPGCLVAGFLGVFSSELSVLTLTVITLERYYAISHALQYSKRLTLRHAGFIMSGGWLFCIVLSSLPLFNISDYRKFAICLPFETSETTSLVYVCFIMLFNTFSFVVIVCCYIKIYASILGSQAWNTKDFRVAKRMAVLVFTDFLCWSPIILFSITAAFGSELIGLNEAKVLTIFVLPLNSCANPFLYAIFTKQFKRDCVKLCKRIEESSISRSLSSLNSRRVSLGCGSSWRHSQLHSPFHTEKRSSCSNSLSGTSSAPGGPLTTNDGGNTFDRGKYYRKQSGDSLMGRSSLSSDDRMERSVRKNSSLNTSPCKEYNFQDTHDKTRKLSVGLAGSESQIVIHLGENSKIKTPDILCKGQNGTKVRSRHSKHAKSLNSPVSEDCDSHSAERPDSPPSINIVGSESTSENVQMVESSQKKIQDMSAKEIFMKYRRNKELQAKKEKRKERSLTNAMLLFRGSSAQNVNDIHKNPVLHLPDKSNEPDKTSHINEWRKSSHLSFLWRNSLDGDGQMPTYKSNSLVELHRSSRDYETTPCKRRSLSSRHEGYILLKSNNRDSAYEDEDEMLEYEDNKEFSVNQFKQLSSMPYSDSSDSNSNSEKRLKRVELKEDEKHSLLGSSPISQPSKRGSCDKESGFGSENLVS